MTLPLIMSEPGYLPAIVKPYPQCRSSKLVQELPEDEEETPCHRVLVANFESGFAQATQVVNRKKRKRAPNKAVKLP